MEGKDVSRTHAQTRVPLSDIDFRFLTTLPPDQWVYTFATRQVPAVLKEALDNAGLTADDVDHLLLQATPHQGDQSVSKFP